MDGVTEPVQLRWARPYLEKHYKFHEMMKNKVLGALGGSLYVRTVDDGQKKDQDQRISTEADRSRNA